jgi:formylmethanofuran dehydrogenase subunit E
MRRFLETPKPDNYRPMVKCDNCGGMHYYTHYRVDKKEKMVYWFCGDRCVEHWEGQPSLNLEGGSNALL